MWRTRHVLSWQLKIEYHADCLASIDAGTRHTLSSPSARFWLLSSVWGSLADDKARVRLLDSPRRRGAEAFGHVRACVRGSQKGKSPDRGQRPPRLKS